MGTFHECDVFLKGTVTEVKRPRSEAISLLIVIPPARRLCGGKNLAFAFPLLVILSEMKNLAFPLPVHGSRVTVHGFIECVSPGILSI